MIQRGGRVVQRWVSRRCPVIVPWGIDAASGNRVSFGAAGGPESTGALFAHRVAAAPAAIPIPAAHRERTFGGGKWFHCRGLAG